MDLETYLRSRNLSDDTIDYFRKEKIDKDAIAAMDNTELQKLFPKYGDRLAITDFCRRHFITAKKKQSLYEKLKQKINKSSDSDDEKEEKSKKIKYNAEKSTTRQIELDWYDEAVNGELKHVRAKKGGGTRKISVSKQIKKDGLIEIAKNLFFPDGISPRGGVRDFIFDLLDSHENVIPEDITVNEMLEKTKLKVVLRFYLKTENKKPDTQSIDISAEKSYKEKTNIEEAINIADTITDNASQFYMSFFQEEIDGTFSENELDLIRSLPSCSVEVIEEDKPLPVYLTLHRGHIMEELINAFCTYNKNVLEKVV